MLVARDRSGQTTDAVLAKLDRASVTLALEGVVTPANQLCHDGGKAIVSFARRGENPMLHLAEARWAEGGSAQPAYQQRPWLSWAPEGQQFSFCPVACRLGWIRQFFCGSLMVRAVAAG